MSSDQLSEVFELVEVRGQMSGGFAAQGRWVTRGAVRDRLKLLAVVSGSARLTTDGVDGPIALDTGDVVILNDRSWMELEGGTGDGRTREIFPEEDHPSTRLTGADCGANDVIVGGRIDLNPAGRTLLQQALPPVVHVRSFDTAATNLRSCLERLFAEVSTDRAGSEFAIRQYGQLVVLEVMRTYLNQSELPSGWLRILTDERLRPALGLMHGEPQRAWTLEQLAGAASMSRTSFAERFRTLAGVPPLRYLTRWRMLLAQRALRDGDIPIGSLATDLGYASESAFSNAFKREVGESPLRYRTQMRNGPPDSELDEVSELAGENSRTP